MLTAMNYQVHGFALRFMVQGYPHYWIAEFT